MGSRSVYKDGDCDRDYCRRPTSPRTTPVSLRAYPQSLRYVSVSPCSTACGRKNPRGIPLQLSIPLLSHEQPSLQVESRQSWLAPTEASGITMGIIIRPIFTSGTLHIVKLEATDFGGERGFVRGVSNSLVSLMESFQDIRHCGILEFLWVGKLAHQDGLIV